LALEAQPAATVLKAEKALWNPFMLSLKACSLALRSGMILASTIGTAAAKQVK
jgi:hypothetical protein